MSKGHEPQDTLRPIPFDASRQICTCHTTNCKTSSKYKYNIVNPLLRNVVKWSDTL